MSTNDIKKFVSIIDEASTATSVEPKRDIAVPALNVNKDANPSMLGKYFRTIEEELAERSKEKKEVANKLAERVTNNINKRISQTHNPRLDVEKTAINSSKKLLQREDSNPIDTVTADIPLLIRLLEYAREDAKTDMDLHNVAEKLIELGKDGETLTMDQYDQIVGEQKLLPDKTDEEPMPSENK